MHEISLVASLLEIIDKAALESPFDRVKTLYLRLGALSCVDADTLRWCITTSAADTRLEGASIVIETEAALAECTHCLHRYTPDTLMTPCPLCGRQAQRLLSGRDMRVTAIDVLQDDASADSGSALISAR